MDKNFQYIFLLHHSSDCMPLENKQIQEINIGVIKMKINQGKIGQV